MQEGMLAKKLFIKLKDRIANAEDMWSGIATMADNVQTPVLRGYWSKIIRVFVWQSNIERTMGLLGFRRSSNPSDEHLVLSTLAGLDTRSLSLLNGEGRICQF